MDNSSSILPDWITKLFSNGGQSGAPDLTSNGSLPGTAGPVGSGILSGGLNLGSGSAAPGSGVTGTATGGATPLGFNTGTGQLAFSGLQSLGNLWNAFQATQMAKKTFDFTKSLANTNLSNQTQAYNTNLEGTTNARFAQENQSPAAALDFINAHKLTQKTL